MQRRRTIALLLIEKDGKILFRKKQGSYFGREEYKDTWVLPGGEVGLDRRVIINRGHKEFPPYIWAEAYAELQLGIKITCPQKYINHPFWGVHEGGILMGYPPGEVVIYCAEIGDDEESKNIIEKILNNEIENKKFLSPNQIREMKQYFHPFYLKHLEDIFGLRKKIQRKESNNKEKLKKEIQTLHGEIHF